MTKRKNYTARYRREDGWWIVTVDELDGVFTHARRIAQVEPLIRDAIALWLEVEPNGFDVQLQPDLPADVADTVMAAVDDRRAAEVAKAQAAHSTSNAVVTLISSGMPTRDVGQLVGISYQRVAQILEESGAKAR